MAKSRGVILRNRGAGLRFWRDEATGDGGMRYLRKRVRRRGERQWRRENGLTSGRSADR
ncbi:hypothetical protein [Verrucosispora sp. WMMC514]|uniref:hypothetical protein n=1 Tax=Verrucosispora sp. WMMC514 TaxID=3015156 RepID=UPI00248A9ED5|nr:hypothetical protein [Verrucosispora sp. WMMC514]WBB94104.1 hypothetical protein O7597_14580 [Verrucosispora sp. WMMC514]